MACTKFERSFYLLLFGLCCIIVGRGQVSCNVQVFEVYVSLGRGFLRDLFCRLRGVFVGRVCYTRGIKFKPSFYSCLDCIVFYLKRVRMECPSF